MISFKEYQQLDEELRLGHKERIHISKTPLSLETLHISDVGDREKPRGLWYGFGDEWISFVKNAFGMYNFKEHQYAYKLFLNSETILSITTREQTHEFVSKYRKDAVPFDKIDWKLVSNDYDGIEFPNYHELGIRDLWIDYSDNVYLFLATWNISSGCIWNPRAIRRLKPL